MATSWTHKNEGSEEHDFVVLYVAAVFVASSYCWDSVMGYFLSPRMSVLKKRYIVLPVQPFLQP